MSALTWGQFEAAELQTRREIDSHKLDSEERQIVRFILNNSFTLGKTAAFLGREIELARTLKMSRSHVNEAIKRLGPEPYTERGKEFPGKNIIASTWPGWYGINIQFNAWRAPRRTDDAHVADEPVLPWEPELRQLLTEVFVENAEKVLPIRVSAADRDLIPGQKSSSEGLRLNTEESNSGGLASPLRVSVGENSPTPAEGRVTPPPSGHGGASGGGPEHVTGVPKSGTKPGGGPARMFPNREHECSQIGNTVVPKSGTSKFDNVDAAFADVPKSGTKFSAPPEVSPPVPPLQERLNVERNYVKRSTVQRSKDVPKSGTPKVTRADESRLMQRLAEFVQADPRCADDMERSGGFWRERVVRNFPDIVDEAISEGNYMVAANREFRNSRAAWLNNFIARNAGLKSLTAVRPGPAPER